MSQAADSKADIVIPPGECDTFSIAGIGVRLTCSAGGDPLTVSPAYGPFRTQLNTYDVDVDVSTVDQVEPADLPVIYNGGYHWRARGDDESLSFEIFHPPSSEVYCRMDGDRGLSRVRLAFGRRNLARLPDAFVEQSRGRMWFPHPFEQLVVIPALARHRGFLVHACGAVVRGKAIVFAGHSGDGKTTLSRLLAEDGVELLSDERVAIRETEKGFVVHGTPWAGEGEVVSSACFPLGGVFVLKKASAHSITRGARATVAAEILARSLVPYYLTDDVATILSLVESAASAVELGEFAFSLDPSAGKIIDALDEFASVA